MGYCNTLACPDLTLAEKAAGMIILTSIYDALPAATKTANKDAITSYTSIVTSLLSELAQQQFRHAERDAFFSIADLARLVATHKALPEPLAQSLASFFAHYRNTHHACYAVTLLRTLAALKPRVGSAFVAVEATYRNAEVELAVVDLFDAPVADVTVAVEDDGETLPVLPRQGKFVVARAYTPGYHALRVVVTKQDAVAFDDTVAVLAAAELTVSKVVVSVNKKETVIVPGSAMLSFAPKDAVTVRVTLESAEVTPATALLVLQSRAGKKISLPLTKREVSVERRCDH